MLTTIQDGDFLACISSTGAELKRFYDGAAKDEILWQGDPAIWKGSAPILFPIVGRLRDGQYTYGGNAYHMPKHGFAVTSEFQLHAKSDNMAAFRLHSTPQTLSMFPFQFELEVKFTLSGSKLNVDYCVSNPGNRPLLFTLGSHPGISTPPSGAPYQVEFDQEETLCVFKLENELLQAKGTPYLQNEKIIKLTPDIFNDDALIFKDIRSHRICVSDAKRQRVIAVETGGTPHLGIWAKPAAPYVCIEPWYGYDETADSIPGFENKPGIITLAPNEEFHTGYSLEKL